MSGRLSRRNQKALATCIVGIIAILFGIVQQRGGVQPVKHTAEQTQPGLYRVVRFDDGDTIAVDMNGTQETIRFIGVDTPETHDPRKNVQCFGQAAADFTKKLIGSSRVRLEADPTNTNRDRYDRLLRYVYLPDGQLVNAEIIKQGYGFAYVLFPFEKLEEFRTYERQARDMNKGLWGRCNPETDTNSGQSHSNDAL